MPRSFVLSHRPAVVISCLALWAAVPAHAQEQLSPSGRFPAVAADGRGGFVTVWTEAQGESWRIVGRRLPPGESPRRKFLVNASAAGAESAPDLAIGPADELLVVWQLGDLSHGAPGDDERADVWAQALNAAGVRRGSHRKLSNTPGGSQTSPRVVATAEGHFIVAWDELRYLPELGFFRAGATARRLRSKGEPLGAELTLETDGEDVSGTSPAAYPGGFAVRWNESVDCSGGRPPDWLGAIARFDSAGRPAAEVYRLGDHGCNGIDRVEGLLGSRAGLLAVSFEGDRHTLRRLAPSGDPPASGIPLGPRPSCSENRCYFVRDAAMDDHGRVAVLWEVRGGQVSTLHVQVYSLRGKALTGRIPVTSGSAFDSSLLAGVAIANDGSLAVVWSREDQTSPAGNGVFARRFHLP